MVKKNIFWICLVSILVVALLLSALMVPIEPRPVEAPKTVSFLILQDAPLEEIKAAILKDPKSVNGRQLTEMPLPPAFENPLACAVVNDRKDVARLLIGNGASVQQARNALRRHADDRRRFDVWIEEFEKKP